jgi:hypothetical protein
MSFTIIAVNLIYRPFDEGYLGKFPRAYSMPPIERNLKINQELGPRLALGVGYDVTGKNEIRLMFAETELILPSVTSSGAIHILYS